MELSQYVTWVKANGERIGELATGDLSADVPPCDGWTQADLIAHMTRVFTMVNGVLETGVRPKRFADLPVGSDIPIFYRDAFDRVMGNLATTDPTEAKWNWSVGPQVASFWWRRMAQETAVHRWDAESAVDGCSPIDPELAADGIDEWFDVHLRSDLANPEISGDAAGTIHVHCTDIEGEWWASLVDRNLDLKPVHAKGDVAIRGNASDLLLVLWGRLPTSTVEVMGDAAVLTSWLELPDI